MPFKIALIGNPNCGKTTLFNALTGALQYVGNWPGVTVEKKEGIYKENGLEVTVVDLPGIYSLSPYSPEEIISRRHIIEGKPDLIINIVDAINLERNLYLTTQLAELGRPMIIALNMIDMLKSRGIGLDFKGLERALGIPVCPISAARGNGILELMQRAIGILQRKKEAEKAYYYPVVKSFYSWRVSAAVDAISELLTEEGYSVNEARFHAVKLFEGDSLTQKDIRLGKKAEAYLKEILESVPETKLVDRQMIIADMRYRFICKICSRVVTKPKNPVATLSDKIDSIMTHRILAIPIFLSLLLLIFTVTFGPPGTFLTNGVDGLINVTLAGWLESFLHSMSVSNWAISLVLDGILAGVGSVLSFLPQIGLLFLFLSILEDSGYMARAAFIMDRPLRKIGLTGRSFMPMLMGFGCTVPAVMGSRILENERDRKATVLLLPFMSCSAKMPVYALFVSVFFQKHKPLIIFSIYLFGILMAVLVGLILKKTVLNGDNATFVMELPEYRMPTAKGLLLHLWERVKDFIVKAGTLLLASSIVIWLLQNLDTSFRLTEDSSKSILAYLGNIIAPVFRPLGFGKWQAAVALLSGVIAKESVVSALEILSPTMAGGGIASLFSGTESAFAFLVFVLFYTPCIAAIYAIHREMRSLKWTVFSVVLQIGIAWLMAFIVFNLGKVIFS